MTNKYDIVGAVPVTAQLRAAEIRQALKPMPAGGRRGA